MRLVAKHAQVGYQTPGERPGCRNCTWFEQGRRESVATTSVTLCLKHGFEITSGGICLDHKLQRQVGQAEADYRARQLELSCMRLDELQSFIPQVGEQCAC